MKTNKIIKVVTKEIEIVACRYTYEVMVDEAFADTFIEKMDGLRGLKEIHQELDKYSYRLLSNEDDERCPLDALVDGVELTNQSAFNLE